MSRAAEPQQLRRVQYRDAHQIDARLELHRRFSVNPLGWHFWLFGQLALPESAAVLELGCGPASLWVENARRIPTNWRVLLSDFSPGMLADAKERLRDVPHRFSFEQIDATSIPLDDASFDCVIANHMLYHVADRPRAFREIRRVLRAGGLLFASTLSADTLQEMGDVVRTATSRKHYTQMATAAGFLLENAADQLAPYFERVESRLYDDALEITETEPLLAYYRSQILDDPFRDEELAAIGEHVADSIARRGAFHVRKQSGVLLAWKAA